MLDTFIQRAYRKLINSPNGEHWWHSMPLPDGDRISGAHDDKDLQLRMWDALRIPDHGLRGKRVLDIGANDGFFSLASLAAGASTVTSIDKDWNTWPKNISYASGVWEAPLEIITGDFRTIELGGRFDVILFLGVLYHLEDVFGAIRRLHSWLVDHGTLYIETQVSKVISDLPIFEYASDVYPTIAHQDKASLSGVGISNYLFPNRQAVFNLAYSYGFSCELLDGDNNSYTARNPLRDIYRLTKLSQGESWTVPKEVHGASRLPFFKRWF
jgi:2-polyprenyl-3-methyl-5-hydroxy-6-metoxy-1,4-benzoquinol methylase